MKLVVFALFFILAPSLQAREFHLVDFVPDPLDQACGRAPTVNLRSVCRITNHERQKRGIPVLVWDSRVARVAQSHASDMHRRDYFSHTTPEGRTYKDRLDRGGVPYMWSGENIAYGYENAEKFMQAWMRSRGHRQNILHPKFTRLGVGWAGDKVVQNFTDGRAKP